MAMDDSAGRRPALSESSDDLVRAEASAGRKTHGPDGRFGPTDAARITPSLGIDCSAPDASDDIGLTNVLVLPIDRTIVVHLATAT